MLYVLCFISVYLLIFINPVMSELCIDPLGVEDGTIPSEQLTASSEYNTFHGAHRGRLNAIEDSDGTGAWVAKYRNQDQWIQVDFSNLNKVRGVITQGRSGHQTSQWVTSYEVLHSVDGNNFEPITNASGQIIVLAGNSDRDTTVTNLFHTTVNAQFIRIHPTGWNDRISLRFEVLGCPVHFTYFKSSLPNGTCGQRSARDSTGSCTRCAIRCMRAPECKTFEYQDGECHLYTDDTNGNYVAFQL